MRGVVRACVDAAWFFQVRAKIARSSFLSDGRFLAAAPLRIVNHHFERMQIYIAVGTILRTQAAADAPIFDNDFQRIAPANRTDGAADHAEWVAALAATRGHEILVEAQAIANETRDAIVRIGACVHASVATRAVLQIQNQQALRFHQSLREKLIDGDVVNHLHALLVCGAAFGRHSFKAGSNAGETRHHVAEIAAGDSHQLDVIERRARRGSKAAAEQADLPEIIAARKIGKHKLAARIVLRNFHEADSNEVETVCRRALLNDDLPGGEALQLHAFLEVLDELRRKVREHGHAAPWKITFAA